MGLISYIERLIGFSLKVVTILVGGASLQIFWEYQRSLLTSLLAKLINLVGLSLLIIIIIAIFLLVVAPVIVLPLLQGFIEWALEVLVGIILFISERLPLIIISLRYCVILIISGIILLSYGFLFLKGMMPSGLVKMVVPTSMGLDDKVVFVFKVGIKEAVFIAKNSPISYSFWVVVTWILSYFIPSKKEIIRP